MPAPCKSGHFSLPQEGAGKPKILNLTPKPWSLNPKTDLYNLLKTASKIPYNF